MDDLHIAIYHYVRELGCSRYPEIKGMDYNLFRKQIEFFKNNFNIVTMEEVIEAWNSENGSLPPKALLLTFDDGYVDNFTTVFPILNENKMQGSFFVTGKTFMENVLLDVNKIHFTLASGDIEEIKKDLLERIDYYRKEQDVKFLTNQELYEKYAVPGRFDPKDVVFVKSILQNVLPKELRSLISSELFEKYVGIREEVFARELYMNLDQIECMRREGMFLGVHGYEHYWLGKLSESEMRSDIDKALDVMSGLIDGDRWVMNYPYGSYNESVVEYIAQKGCKLALTTELRVADLKRDNKYLLPRLDCNDFPPKSNHYLQAGNGETQTKND